jgi:hypothetical protein
LERAFEEEKVFEVVKSLNSEGFGFLWFFMAFFQACWDVLKVCIMNVFHDFHARGLFENNSSATFITLFPKNLGAVDIKDFQPISLVVGVYKIVAKALANRLKMVAENISSKP